MQILIVEDSKTQALALRATLEDAGYSVIAAEDGPSGFEACVRGPVPALVVSDILMPGYDGYELCRRIKADPRTAGVPVMLLTSLSAPEDVAHALDAGADNFVGKPYTADLLLTRVRRTLSDGPRVPLRDVLVSALEDAAARNAELAASKAQLLEASRQREQMLSVVAHELKNPLNTIVLRAQLQRNARVEPRGKTLVEVVLHQAMRMNVIIEDLLDMARIETGEFELRLERVSLSELVASVIERQREVSAGRTVSPHITPSLSVRADAGRIEQILTNFITNAFKYSPHTSAVDVRAELRGASARVSVRDQGIGIEAASLPRVFERYFRTDEGKRTAEGIGVGLYLCKLLVEQQGGVVGVDSEPGNGSAFWFELPLDFGG
jgi:two-component system sensor histidine kinase/response regulator